MASRHEEGFYKRLQSFFTTDKWKALQSPVKRRPPRTDVYEVGYILGKRKRFSVTDELCTISLSNQPSILNQHGVGVLQTTAKLFHYRQVESFAIAREKETAKNRCF